MPKTDLATLGRLVEGTVTGDSRTVVSDVIHDSRDSSPETLFVAIRGFRVDGHDYVQQAIDGGASAVCVESPQELAASQLIVPDTRAALPKLAAEVHGHPSHKLRVVGVTGTNGKTTVTFMVESIATVAGGVAGRLGTLGARSNGRSIALQRTTPEASDVQRLLAAMVEDGVDVVAMEVSSHALELGRAAEIRYAVAAFTNLSVDHLDFHSDLAAYFEAKARLFDFADTKVIYRSEWGDRLAARHPDALLVGPGGQITARDVVETKRASRFTLATPHGDAAVDLPVAGDFNISNALVAAGCAVQLGYSVDIIAAGLTALSTVPGRMERVEWTGPFDIYVDYAHTPEGVEVAISAARRFTQGRVIVVVGAGGDRDESKRPLMGAASSAADVVWVTSDNPRSEDPNEIISQILAGLPDSSTLHVEPDRGSAIRGAVGSARPTDTVLILGKGHEQGQEVGGVLLPFDDHQVASEAVAEVAT